MAEDAKPRAPKVTVREKPTDEVIRNSLKETVVTDDRGRKITLTRPSILSQFELPLIVGPAASANSTYMRMILPLLFVSAIDGDTVFFPARKVEIDALINRLDEDGITAVMLGVEEHFGQPDPEAQKDKVKNSAADLS